MVIRQKLKLSFCDELTKPTLVIITAVHGPVVYYLMVRN